MFWQNCFSVHLNFLFPSLGSGSLSNYSWEVNKYLVSCQTQEVLQIGNCFFSAKILVLFAMLFKIFLLLPLLRLVYPLSDLTALVTITILRDMLFMTPWPPGLGPDAGGPGARLRLTTSGDAARASGWFGRRETRDMVTLYSCTLQYTCTLYSPTSGPSLYNLNPTINCRRLSLFTHTAEHNQQTGGRRKTWRRNKRELFLTSLLASNCFSLRVACAQGLLGLSRI